MLTLHSPPDHTRPTDDGQHDTAHGSGQPLIHRPQIEVADVVRRVMWSGIRWHGVISRGMRGKNSA